MIFVLLSIRLEKTLPSKFPSDIQAPSDWLVSTAESLSTLEWTLAPSMSCAAWLCMASRDIPLSNLSKGQKYSAVAYSFGTGGQVK